MRVGKGGLWVRGWGLGDGRQGKLVMLIMSSISDWRSSLSVFLFYDN